MIGRLAVELRSHGRGLGETLLLDAIHRVARAGRHLAIGRAIYWFDIDEEREMVRVLAVFFGGEDHVRHMLVRLLDG